MARGAIAAAAAVAGLCHAGLALAGMLGPDPPLRIVSFDLAAAPGAVKPPPPEKPSWRTTFGAEIRSVLRRDTPAISLDADVVLLQGLSSIRDVRRHFPAREWKLVASRQLLSGSEESEAASSDVSAVVPTTAVAVRFQKGLRIAGQEHLMDLAAADGVSGEQKPVAGTAVRLIMDGRPIWVVSVSLSQHCAGSNAKCLAKQRLSRWRNQRRLLGEETVIGGIMRPEAAVPATASARGPGEGPAPTGAEACASQDIEADPVPGRLVQLDAWREHHAFGGCIARFDLPR